MTDLKSMHQRKEAQDPSKTPTRARKLLRAALFFAGSAAFGGLAVALWDRKILTAMRWRDAQPSEQPRPPDEDVD
jgi:fatty acid desaturase